MYYKLRTTIKFYLKNTLLKMYEIEIIIPVSAQEFKNVKGLLDYYLQLFKGT